MVQRLVLVDVELGAKGFVADMQQPVATVGRPIHVAGKPALEDIHQGLGVLQRDCLLIVTSHTG